MAIKFYGTRSEYGFLSNFYPAKFEFDGKIYLTSEHAFQAKKFDGTDKEELIRNTKTPGEAKKLAWKFKPQIGWDRIRNEIMKKIVYEKFAQNESLKQQLLETGEETLVEHTSNDSYWGDGGDGSGKNMLGKILMEVRSKFNEERQSEEKQNA
jgi:ribA/ribD-fused uncharacterized protein